MTFITSKMKTLLKYNFSNSNSYLHYVRNIINKKLSSTVADVKSDTVKKSKNKVSKSQELKDFIDTHPDLQNYESIPDKFFKRRRKHIDELYLIDKSTAKVFALLIKDKLLSKAGAIIEINPGLGFLTSELLNHGVKHIQLFEPIDYFYSKLNFDTSRVILKTDDLLTIWKSAYQDRFDNGTRLSEILSNVEADSWKNSPSMVFIGAIPNINIIKHVINSIITQSGLVTYGRPEFFVAIPPMVYKHLTSTTSDGFLFYRATSVLFQLFFEFEILGKLPRSSFLPWQIETNSKEKTDDSLLVVRLTANKYLPVPNDKLQQVWYFIKHHMLSRKKRVIPELEKWIPGCGAQIILSNRRKTKNDDYFDYINIFTRFGDLTPQQILYIFKLFVNLPEYPECPFIASMDSSLLKLESSGEPSEKVEALDMMDTIISSVDKKYDT